MNVSTGFRVLIIHCVNTHKCNWLFLVQTVPELYSYMLILTKFIDSLNVTDTILSALLHLTLYFYLLLR